MESASGSRSTFSRRRSSFAVEIAPSDRKHIDQLSESIKRSCCKLKQSRTASFVKLCISKLNVFASRKKSSSSDLSSDSSTTPIKNSIFTRKNSAKALPCCDSLNQGDFLHATKQERSMKMIISCSKLEEERRCYRSCKDLASNLESFMCLNRTFQVYPVNIELKLNDPNKSKSKPTLNQSVQCHIRSKKARPEEAESHLKKSRLHRTVQVSSSKLLVIPPKQLGDVPRDATMSRSCIHREKNKRSPRMKLCTSSKPEHKKKKVHLLRESFLTYVEVEPDKRKEDAVLKVTDNIFVKGYAENTFLTSSNSIDSNEVHISVDNYCQYDRELNAKSVGVNTSKVFEDNYSLLLVQEDQCKRSNQDIKVDKKTAPAKAKKEASTEEAGNLEEFLKDYYVGGKSKELPQHLQTLLTVPPSMRYNDLHWQRERASFSNEQVTKIHEPRESIDFLHAPEECAPQKGFRANPNPNNNNNNKKKFVTSLNRDTKKTFGHEVLCVKKTDCQQSSCTHKIYEETLSAFPRRTVNETFSCPPKPYQEDHLNLPPRRSAQGASSAQKAVSLSSKENENATTLQIFNCELKQKVKEERFPGFIATSIYDSVATPPVTEPEKRKPTKPVVNKKPQNTIKQEAVLKSNFEKNLGRFQTRPKGSRKQQVINVYHLATKVDNPLRLLEESDRFKKYAEEATMTEDVQEVAVSESFTQTKTCMQNIVEFTKTSRHFVNIDGRSYVRTRSRYDEECYKSSKNPVLFRPRVTRTKAKETANKSLLAKPVVRAKADKVSQVDEPPLPPLKASSPSTSSSSKKSKIPVAVQEKRLQSQMGLLTKREADIFYQPLPERELEDPLTLNRTNNSLNFIDLKARSSNDLAYYYEEPEPFLKTIDLICAEPVQELYAGKYMKCVGLPTSRVGYLDSITECDEVTGTGTESNTSVKNEPCGSSVVLNSSSGGFEVQFSSLSRSREPYSQVTFARNVKKKGSDGPQWCPSVGAWSEHQWAPTRTARPLAAAFLRLEEVQEQSLMLIIICTTVINSNPKFAWTTLLLHPDKEHTNPGNGRKSKYFFKVLASKVRPVASQSSKLLLVLNKKAPSLPEIARPNQSEPEPALKLIQDFGEQQPVLASSPEEGEKAQSEEYFEEGTTTAEERLRESSSVSVTTTFFKDHAPKPLPNFALIHNDAVYKYEIFLLKAPEESSEVKAFSGEEDLKAIAPRLEQFFDKKQTDQLKAFLKFAPPILARTRDIFMRHLEVVVCTCNVSDKENPEPPKNPDQASMADEAEEMSAPTNVEPRENEEQSENVPKNDLVDSFVIIGENEGDNKSAEIGEPDEMEQPKQVAFVGNPEELTTNANDKETSFSAEHVDESLQAQDGEFAPEKVHNSTGLEEEILEDVAAGPSEEQHNETAELEQQTESLIVEEPQNETSELEQQTEPSGVEQQTETKSLNCFCTKSCQIGAPCRLARLKCRDWPKNQHDPREIIRGFDSEFYFPLRDLFCKKKTRNELLPYLQKAKAKFLDKAGGFVQKRCNCLRNSPSTSEDDQVTVPENNNNNSSSNDVKKDAQEKAQKTPFCLCRIIYPLKCKCANNPQSGSEEPAGAASTSFENETVKTPPEEKSEEPNEKTYQQYHLLVDKNYFILPVLTRIIFPDAAFSDKDGCLKMLNFNELGKDTPPRTKGEFRVYNAEEEDKARKKHQKKKDKESQKSHERSRDSKRTSKSRKEVLKRKKGADVCLYIPSDDEEDQHELQSEEIATGSVLTANYLMYIPCICGPTKSLTAPEVFDSVTKSASSNDVEIVSKRKKQRKVDEDCPYKAKCPLLKSAATNTNKIRCESACTQSRCKKRFSAQKTEKAKCCCDDSSDSSESKLPMVRRPDKTNHCSLSIPTPKAKPASESLSKDNEAEGVVNLTINIATNDNNGISLPLQNGEATVSNQNSKFQDVLVQTNPVPSMCRCDSKTFGHQVNERVNTGTSAVKIWKCWPKFAVATTSTKSISGHNSKEEEDVKRSATNSRHRLPYQKQQKPPPTEIPEFLLLNSRIVYKEVTTKIVESTRFFVRDHDGQQRLKVGDVPGASTKMQIVEIAKGDEERPEAKIDIEETNEIVKTEQNLADLSSRNEAKNNQKISAAIAPSDKGRKELPAVNDPEVLVTVGKEKVNVIDKDKQPKAVKSADNSLITTAKDSKEMFSESRKANGEHAATDDEERKSKPKKRAEEVTFKTPSSLDTVEYYPLTQDDRKTSNYNSHFPVANLSDGSAAPNPRRQDKITKLTKPPESVSDDLEHIDEQVQPHGATSWAATVDHHQEEPSPKNVEEITAERVEEKNEISNEKHEYFDSTNEQLLEEEHPVQNYETNELQKSSKTVTYDGISRPHSSEYVITDYDPLFAKETASCSEDCQRLRETLHKICKCSATDPHEHHASFPQFPMYDSVSTDLEFMHSLRQKSSSTKRKSMTCCKSSKSKTNSSLMHNSSIGRDCGYIVVEMPDPKELSEYSVLLDMHAEEPEPDMKKKCFKAGKSSAKCCRKKMQDIYEQMPAYYDSEPPTKGKPHEKKCAKSSLMCFKRKPATSEPNCCKDKKSSHDEKIDSGPDCCKQKKSETADEPTHRLSYPIGVHNYAIDNASLMVQLPMSRIMVPPNSKKQDQYMMMRPDKNTKILVKPGELKSKNIDVIVSKGSASKSGCTKTFSGSSCVPKKKKQSETDVTDNETLKKSNVLEDACGEDLKATSKCDGCRKETFTQINN